MSSIFAKIKVSLLFVITILSIEIDVGKLDKIEIYELNVI